MKNLILSGLLIVLISACHEKKETVPEPLPVLEAIASKWRLVRSEYKQMDSVIVQPVQNGEVSIIAFRYDGLLLNEAGQAACCAPSSYLINGKPFEIKQIGEAPPPDPKCIYADCFACPQWILTQEGDSLTVELCPDAKMYYVREK